VVIACGATYPTGFVEAMRAITMLFDITEFRTLANRIEALEAIGVLEEVEPELPPSEPPDWHNIGRLHTLIPPLGTLIQETDRLLESLEVKSSLASQAFDELEAALQKKISQVDKAIGALESLQKSLSQNFGGVHILVQEGPFGSIPTAGYPMNYKFNACLALAGNTVDLGPLRKLIGQ